MKKKNLILVAMATALLATSCAEEQQFGGAVSNSAIALHPTIGKVGTRATETTTANLHAFRAYSFLTDDNVNYMDGVTYSNSSGDWNTSEGSFYWPVKGELNFYCYAPETPGEAGTFSIDPSSQKLTGFAPFPSAATQQDLVYAKATGSLAANATSGLDVNFLHALSEITIAAKNTNAAYTVEVSGVKLGNVISEGDFTFPSVAGADASWSLGTERSDYTTEWQNATTLSSTVSSLDASNTAFMLVPQQLAAQAKAIDGNYIALKVKITMQGGQVVHDGWAYVAIPTLWEMNKHYAYTLDFSEGAGQDENGNDIISGSGIKFNVTVTPWDEENIDINWKKYIYGQSKENYVLLYINGENIFMNNLQDGQWKYDVTNLNVSSLYFQTKQVSLDLSNLNINGISDLSEMFNRWGQIKLLNLSGWNTHNVTNMGWMFNDCSSLETLDISGWDTHNVTQMEGMFSSCLKLSSMNVSSFDTQNVTNMSQMFCDCHSLTTLDVSNFNTGNVTNMSQMFYECNSLETLDLSGWDTRKVVNMSQMFWGCSNLKNINMSGWDMTSMIDEEIGMRTMFYYNDKPKTLDMSNWKINKDFTFRYVLSSGNLEKVILKNININDRKDISYILTQGVFKTIDVSGWNTSQVTNMSSAFEWCQQLTSLDLSDWDVSNVTNMNSMFDHCYSLTSLDLSGWDMSKVNDIRYMFTSCQKLKNIYMVECKEATVNKIKQALTECGWPTDIVKTTR